MRETSPEVINPELSQGKREKEVIRGITAAAAASLALFGAGLHSSEAAAAPASSRVACGPSTPAKQLPVLVKGMKGSCVRYYQTLLARHDYLPSGQVDGIFGDETVGRTVGFQIQNNIRGTDGTLGTGNAGPLTWATARKAETYHGLPKVCREMTFGACASKYSGTIKLIRNGRPIRTFPAGFGLPTPDRRSDEGVFSVYNKVRHDVSRQFNNAPMENSIYYHGGEAVHAGAVGTPSHGCVHVSLPASEVLYKNLPIGSSLVVY